MVALNTHPHGTYDTQGVFHQQRVTLGCTAIGQCGLFTGGMLAWPLQRSEYDALRAMPQRELRDYVMQRGFDLYPQQED